MTHGESRFFSSFSCAVYVHATPTNDLLMSWCLLERFSGAEIGNANSHGAYTIIVQFGLEILVNEAFMLPS